MRSLIIGGAGLVGSHLAKRCSQVKVLDDLSRGVRENLPSHAELTHASVEKAQLVADMVRWADVVFYLAAIPVTVCESDPDRAHLVHVQGLATVAGACATMGKRLVYASTGSVYGEQECMPIPEHAPRFGANIYAKTKIQAESLLELIGPDFVGLRYMSIYGKAVQRGPVGVVMKFISQAKAGQPLTVYGDGSETYDFISVNDVVEATLAAAEQGKGFYNVATGKGTSIVRLAEMIAELSGASIMFGRGPILTSCMVGDTGLAGRDLCFWAKTDLPDGLKMLWGEC